MKTRVPSRLVECCDICLREAHGLLDKCEVCGKEYCPTCRAIMPGCIRQPDVCKTCGNLEDVERTVDALTPEIATILKKRTQALNRIGKKLVTP